VSWGLIAPDKCRRGLELIPGAQLEELLATDDAERLAAAIDPGSPVGVLMSPWQGAKVPD
jgi:hypothetical protein